MAQGATAKRLLLLFVALLAVIAGVAVAFRSRIGLVQADELSKLIDRADSLVVLEAPRDGAAVLFESAERRDLDALKQSLQVEQPDQYMHCMCDGTPAIFLYAKAQKIGQITNHHGNLIRCNLWNSDARLVSNEALFKWFDDRNIPAPRKEYEDALERKKKYEEYARRWVEAMPASLRPLWPAADRSFDPDVAPLRRALAEQYPARNDRVVALFSWYGSGAGPWSGFPAYESIAEKMLLDYSTAELIAAIETVELTQAQTEGVARLFGGWEFSQLRPNERQLLPAELKARLLKHSLASADEDKRGRAKRAFESD
jgi:hypothetical protein